MKRILLLAFVVCGCQFHVVVKPPPVTIEPSLMPTITPTPENK